MADVSDTSGVDRAQLILVSGLMIAVTLLVLVLLLNTVIYTENVATRGIDSDVSEAADFQEVIDEELIRILNGEHDTFEGGQWADLNDSVTVSATILFDQQAQSAIQRGHIAEGSIESAMRGIALSTEITSLELNVTSVEDSRLLNLTGELKSGESVNLSTDEMIRIQGTEYGINISAGEDDLCDIELSGAFTVSLANGTVHTNEGVHQCEELSDRYGDLFNTNGADLNIQGEDEASWDVEFVGGGDSIESEVDHEWIMYSVEVNLEYHSSDLSYTTTRTLIPEVNP